MGTIPQSFFRDIEGRAKVSDLKRALVERVEIGDLTPLVTERVQDPLAYIGQVATEIATQSSDFEGGQNA